MFVLCIKRFGSICWRWICKWCDHGKLVSSLGSLDGRVTKTRFMLGKEYAGPHEFPMSSRDDQLQNRKVLYTELSEWGRGSVGRGSVSRAKSQVRAGSYSISFISTIYLEEYEFYYTLCISSPNNLIIYGEGKMVKVGKTPSIEEI